MYLDIYMPVDTGRPKSTGFKLLKNYIMSGWGAAAAAAGSIIGGVIQGGMQANAQKKADGRNFDAQIRLMDYANAYNTPLQQRKRLEEAGLNPALMYNQMGSHTSATPTAKDSAPRSMPQIGASIPQAIEAYINYTMMDKQMQVMDTSIAQKKQQIATARADEQMKQFYLDYKLPSDYDRTQVGIEKDKFMLGKDRAMFPYQLDAAKLNNENLEARTAGVILDNARKEITNSNLDAKQKADILLIYKTLEEKAANIANSNSRTKGQDLENAMNEELKRFNMTSRDNVYARGAIGSIKYIKEAVEAIKFRWSLVGK